VTSTDQSLAAFGVRPSEDLGYLLDVERSIIIAEGLIPAVNAKVKEWEEVAPGRFRMATGDELDSRAIYEWEQFKVHNPGFWVIR
jgi:hypothetical protein